MEDEARLDIPGAELAAEASDLLTAPDGIKRFVDLIGDENIDTAAAAADPGSDVNRNF